MSYEGSLPAHLLISPDHLKFIELVESGSYGDVWRAVWHGAITVAVKRIPLRGAAATNISIITKEVSILGIFSYLNSLSFFS